MKKTSMFWISGRSSDKLVKIIEENLCVPWNQDPPGSWEAVLAASWLRSTTAIHTGLDSSRGFFGTHWSHSFLTATLQGRQVGEMMMLWFHKRARPWWALWASGPQRTGAVLEHSLRLWAEINPPQLGPLTDELGLCPGKTRPVSMSGFQSWNFFLLCGSYQRSFLLLIEWKRERNFDGTNTE